MIFNEIKSHVSTFLGLLGGMHPLHTPYVRAWVQQCSSKFCNLPLQAQDRTRANCAVALNVSGLHGHDFARMGLAFIYPALPTCLVVYVQKSDFCLINVFCV